MKRILTVLAAALVAASGSAQGLNGTPEAISDVIAGRNDWFFAPLSSALPLIRDGKLQVLAVSTARRSPALTEVPTTVEAGVANSDYPAGSA